MHSLLLLPLALFASQALANPLPRANVVTLDSAKITGATVGRVTKFLGIPFAKPPTGDRRFRLPETIPPYMGNIHATEYGPTCPQQTPHILPQIDCNDTDVFANKLCQPGRPESEDCLTINVIVPKTATPISKLPVLVWIFGGGFEGGDPSVLEGDIIVERSITVGQPVVYVSMNYRLSGFGFLASKEVKEARVGNLGLQDQREALRWVQKYIQSFGGNPEKVTLWGVSAGAISAALHMVANNGNNEGLFHGAFMHSGSPIPVGDITHGQQYYDAIVRDTGCSKSPDTLECLRGLPYVTLKKAIDNTPHLSDYQSLILAWLPRVDGVFLTDAPQRLVQMGLVANIPFVTGDCDDEGTVFAFSTLNITTTPQLKTYLKTYWIPLATDTELDTLLNLYPRQGLPFPTPQFYRIASFEGDAVFQAPRRFFLQQRSASQDAWAFLSKRYKSSRFHGVYLGAHHGSDMKDVYYNTGRHELQDYIINFVNNLDPNGKGLKWPKYTVESPSLMTFNDNPLRPVSISQDTFRVDPMEYLTNLTLKYPI